MKLKRILSGTLAFILGLSVINFSAFAEDRLPAFPEQKVVACMPQEQEAEILL